MKMMIYRSKSSGGTTVAVLAAALLHVFASLWQPALAFLVAPSPVRQPATRTATTTTTSRSILRWGTAGASHRCSATTDGGADTDPGLQPVKEVDSSLEEENTEGMIKSPAGLTLEGVYKRLKVEVQGLDDGVVGLESRDKEYGVEIVKVKVKREPSLGMRLEEVARGGDGRGLVLVAGLEPGGNAEATGKIYIGDTISWVGVEPNGMIRVEAFDWDRTVGALGELTQESEITVVIKRLVKRESINVQFELPSGDQKHDILAGSNLRGEMIRLGVPVYDPKTLRYDQPYATGNCAGEGICGTCFVEVKEGAELLSPADQEENVLMAQGGLPARWRLSCKTIVGRENVSGTVKIKAVPQTEWREERQRRRGG